MPPDGHMSPPDGHRSPPDNHMSQLDLSEEAKPRIEPKLVRGNSFEATRSTPSSPEARKTRDFLQRNRDQLELQSSLNLARRKLQPPQRAYSHQTAMVSQGQLARSSSLVTLRSVGKFSTQLDPSHLTPAQVRHLREQPPDSYTRRELTRRASAYRGLLPSASASTLPQPVVGITLSTTRPLPQFKAARPKQKSGLEIMSSIPFSEQLVDRLKEVDGMPLQFLSLVKRGEWFYRQR